MKECGVNDRKFLSACWLALMLSLAVSLVFFSGCSGVIYAKDCKLQSSEQDIYRCKKL